MYTAHTTIFLPPPVDNLNLMSVKAVLSLSRPSIFSDVNERTGEQAREREKRGESHVLSTKQQLFTPLMNSVYLTTSVTIYSQ